MRLPPVEAGEVPPEGWTVEPGAPPSSTGALSFDEPWQAVGSWELALAGAFAASGNKATPTRAMSCLAREIGRFFLVHRASPPEALQRFAAAACGVVVPEVGSHWLAGTAPAGTSDDKLLEHWRAQLGPGLVGHLPAAARHVGFWFGRHDRQAIAVAVYDSMPLELKPFALVPNVNGDLVLEGRVLGAAAQIVGYANRGRFDVSSCTSAPDVAAPAFKVTCRVAPDDETAWLQILYAPPHSVLQRPLVQMLARRDATRPLSFTETPYSTPRPVADAASFAPAVLAALNDTRGEAGLPPVRLAEAESATATRLSRHYFASWLAPAHSGGVDMDTVALGLLAGWEVTDGPIREGSFLSTLVPRTHDAGRWLDAALALPLGRRTLLARDIDEVAIGPALFEKPDATGALVCGYRFQHGDDHADDVAVLQRRIARARRDMNLGEPRRLETFVPALTRNLARVRQGTLWPAEALQLALNEISRQSGRTVQGYLIETTSPDSVELPATMLRSPGLALEIAVTHYKPPGAAWAQLAILIVYTGAPTTQA